MREIDFERLEGAAQEGRQLLSAWPREDGTHSWTLQTQQLFLDLFGQTTLTSAFWRGYPHQVVMRAMPEDVVLEGRRLNLKYRVEVVEAALETAKRRSSDGPIPRDPLLEAERLASEIPLTSVSDYLRDARERYAQQKWEEAVNHAAKAYERTAYVLADLVTGKIAPRDFSGAMDILKTNGVVEEETVSALKVPNVSLWGWVCIKGRHAEGAAKGKPASTWTEARYALDWAGSAIAFLGESYLEWVEKNRAAKTGKKK